MKVAQCMPTLHQRISISTSMGDGPFPEGRLPLATYLSFTYSLKSLELFSLQGALQF